jgi:hypothetical protein
MQLKYNASRVMLFPNQGKGLVVGAALRDIVTILQESKIFLVRFSQEVRIQAQHCSCMYEEHFERLATKYIFGGLKGRDSTCCKALEEKKAGIIL